MADRSRRFEQLEENIEAVIDHCREGGIMVCDYQPGVAFSKKLNDLVLKLQDVDKMKQDTADVLVPIAVFSKIDAGQNPQIYSRECMERVIEHNEAVHGKLDSIRRFRHLLIDELGKRFPGEVLSYRSMRGEVGNLNAVESNRQSGSFHGDSSHELFTPPTR